MSIRHLMIYVPHSKNNLRILSDVYTKKKSWWCVHLFLDVDMSSFFKNWCTRRQKISVFLCDLQGPTLVQKVIDVYIKKKKSRHGFWKKKSDTDSKMDILEYTSYIIFYFFSWKIFWEFCPMCTSKKKVDDVYTYFFNVDMYIKKHENQTTHRYDIFVSLLKHP
jgi:hypothetical protein